MLPIQPERLDALLTFSWHQRWSKYDILVALYALTLAKSPNDAQWATEAVFCLGSILMKQAQWNRLYYREADVRFNKAKDLLVALGDDFPSFSLRNGKHEGYCVVFWCKRRASNISFYSGKALS